MESGQNVALFSEDEPFRATKMWNELVRNLKSGVRVKRKRWRMKYYDDCFSGSEALAWIHDFLKANPNFGKNISRKQAKLLCQKLLQRNVFEDVLSQSKSTKPAFDENHLYSFVNKAGVKDVKVGIDGKENYTCKAEKKPKRLGSTIKRHSSFSDKLQLRRKPLGDRKGLQNISQHVNNINDSKLIRSKPTVRSNLKQNVDACGLVLENKKTVHTQPEESNIQVRNQQSEKVLLNRKWKSEYDISLMKKNEESSDEEYMSCNEDFVCEEKSSNQHEPSANKNTQTTKSLGKLNEICTNQNNTEEINNKFSQEPSKLISNKNEENNCKVECFQENDPNELWMTVCLERLRHVLNVSNLNDILNVDFLSWRNIMENVTSNIRNVTEAVPKWLVSAMKCLIHWPDSVKPHAADHLGFENDIFKTIKEHFELLPETLVSSSFVDVFTKISGIITKHKLSGIRALQFTFLLLEEEKRQQLQLLLRFMIKVSKNHQLNLSSHLPTRELVIQTFVPCIFGDTTHEILGIRITSFIMENYAEVFKIPDGLKFEVEQQIAFRRGVNAHQEGRQSNDISFCLRVTKQEYEEQKQLGKERFLEDLLDSIVHDEKLNEKERKKKIKQFQKTYPEIYFSRYPTDTLSIMSQQPAKLRRVIKPLTRRQMKNLR